MKYRIGKYECEGTGKIWVESFRKDDGTFVHGYCEEGRSATKKNEIIEKKQKELVSILNKISDMEGYPESVKQKMFWDTMENYHVDTIVNDGSNVTDGVYEIPGSRKYIYYEYPEDGDMTKGKWSIDKEDREES